MKKIFLSILLLGFACFVSCEKDNPSSGQNNGTTNPNTHTSTVTGVFTAKINGLSYTAARVDLLNLGNSLIFAGSAGNQIFEFLVVNNHTGANNVGHPLVQGQTTLDSSFAAYSPDTSQHLFYFASKGAILNITKYDFFEGILTGSFEFPMETSDNKRIYVSDGSFNLRFNNPGGTFDFLYNGTSYKSQAQVYSSLFKTPLYDSLYQVQDSVYTININSINNNDPNVYIDIPENLAPGTYGLDKNTQIGYFQISVYDKNDTYSWGFNGSSVSDNSGSVTITRNDKVKKRITGSLQNVLVDNNNGGAKKPVSATFDVKY